MGKLFLAGTFLGAAVTFAVMYYVVPWGIPEEELTAKLKEAKERQADATAAEKDLDCKAKLQAQEAKLKKEHGTALAEREGRITSLDGEKKALAAKVKQAAEDLAALTRKRDALEDEFRDLKRKLAGRPTAPKRLLVQRMKLAQSRVKLWRTLGEVASVLTQAKIGWPDVHGARSTSKELSKLVSEHAALSNSVKIFVEENSKELETELGDRFLKALRISVRDDYIKAISGLAKKILAAVSKMKSDSAVIEAKRDGWTDTEVIVERGDIIHVRADGIWRMIAHWQTAGPAGWDGGGQYRISHAARTGSLIMRIGVSDKIVPAYLGKPIVADSAGRVVFRMNDKNVGENGGSVEVKVTSANPASLDGAASAWKKMKQ